MKSVNLYIILLSLGLALLSCGTSSKVVTTNEFRVLSQSDYYNKSLDKDSRSNIAAQMVTNASIYKQQGRYADAVIEYQEALRMDTSASLYFLLAESYWYLGKRVSAIENCYNAVKFDSTYLPAYELLYNMYSNDNMLSEAYTIAEQILAIEPTRNNKIRYAVLKGIENPKESARLLESLLSDSTDTETMLLLSSTYEQAKEYDKMLKIMERMHKNQPSNFEVASGLIDYYIDTKDLENLFRILESSEKYYDSYQMIAVYNNIGVSLLAADLKANAHFLRNYINRIDEKFYFDWLTQSLAGKLSSRLLDTVSTEKFYNRAMLLNDTNAYIYLDAAIAYSTLNLHDKSIEILNTGKEKFIDDSRFDFYLCNAYMLKNDYLTAETYGEKVFKADSSNVVYVTLYASILQQLQKYDDSDRLYELSLTLDPNDANTNNNYAYSLSIRSKELSKAQKLSYISLQLEPDNSAYLDTYGWIQFKIGNLERALEYVQKAIEVGEVSAEVFEHLGDIYIGLNNKSAALEAYSKSLELDENKKSEVADKIKLLKN